MGLLENLFMRKNCSVCGKPLGPGYSVRLKDGRCCSACARKLSPWSSDRKKRTVNNIKEEIAFRDAHKNDFKDFYPTRFYGNSCILMIDEIGKRFAVTSELNFRKEVVDILMFSQVQTCLTQIEKSRKEVLAELKDNPDDPDSATHNESYRPRRYRWYYDFQLVLKLNHPILDTIRFSISGGPFSVTPVSQLRNEGSIQEPTKEECMEDYYYARYAGEMQELKLLFADQTPGQNHRNLPRELLVFGPFIALYVRAHRELQYTETFSRPEKWAAARFDVGEAYSALKANAAASHALAEKAGVNQVLQKYENNE